MHTVFATVCYGKNKKEAFESGLKMFDGDLKYRREELGYVDWYHPFDGKRRTDNPGYEVVSKAEVPKGFELIHTDDRNRYQHERWEPVIEGDSEKAKEIFDFLRIVEEREAKDEKWWYGIDKEMQEWIESDKLWAERLLIQADNKYGYKITEVDKALKEVEGKRFYVVAVDMHY